MIARQHSKLRLTGDYRIRSDKTWWRITTFGLKTVHQIHVSLFTSLQVDASRRFKCSRFLDFLHIIMGIGAIAEPLVVVTLLFGGTWVNRNKEYKLFGRRAELVASSRSSSPDSESGHPAVSSESLLAGVDEVPKWRTREIRILGFRTEVASPNSRRFKDYFLSRLLRKFPFLVEAWYWALIYWVCSHLLYLPSRYCD